jgi:hypothetical protein
MGVEPNFQKQPPSGKQHSITKKRSNSRGTDGRMQWRTEVLPKVKEVLCNFRRIGVYHPTVRAVYYKLYSMGAIPENSIKMYKGLDRMLTDVRMEQEDPIVAPDTFADDSRPDPDRIDMETPQEFAEDWADTIENAHLQYKAPRWYKQPKYVEVWIEKQAMYSTFESILSDKQVVIQSGKGFNSLTALYRACMRLIRVRMYEGRGIVILYFGDLDPSGDSMDDDIRRRLRAFGLYSFELIRVGVKREHVQEYDLPADPDEDTAERLRKNDSRTLRFVNKYGRLYAIELDALAGKEPEAFSSLVRDAVDEHFDESIWDKYKNKLTTKAAQREIRKRIKVIE